MKIIQMIYSLSSGGAEKFVVDLSNQLVKMGHDVILCILLNTNNNRHTFNKQFLDSKIKLHSMEFDKGFSLDKCKRVEKFIISENPDILHCHLNVIPYIFKFALLRNKPVIFHTLHNVATETGGKGLQYHFNRFFYKCGKIRPVCISQICKRTYEEYYRLHNAPVIVNGRAAVEISNQFEEVKQEITSYKKTAKTKVFIHVARCNKQKNQRLLIDSFNRLNAENVDFILLIIGSGFESTDGVELKKSACDRIFFLGEKNNVVDYLQCSHAFCLTSVYEGLPISLLEALSCGITPICTPVGGIPDVITDNINGYLSSGIDIDSYIHALKRYMEKPLSPQILIEHYQNNYSIETCATKYETLYNDVM